MPVEEEGDQTEERHYSDLACGLLARESAQSQPQKQKG